MKDLFQEIAVTQSEIDTWISENTRLTAGTWRAANYARAWNVAEKIAFERARAAQAARLIRALPRIA